jgi:predicted PurR-regulated permease PerM
VSGGNGANPQRRRSVRPFRDSVLAYAALGSLVVIFAYVTGSTFLKALAGGIAAFVLATAYTWWRLRSRRRESP